MQALASFTAHWQAIWISLCHISVKSITITQDVIRDILLTLRLTSSSHVWIGTSTTTTRLTSASQSLTQRTLLPHLLPQHRLRIRQSIPVVTDSQQVRASQVVRQMRDFISRAQDTIRFVTLLQWQGNGTQSGEM